MQNQELKNNEELYTMCEGEAQQTLFKEYLTYIGPCKKCGTRDYVSYVAIGRPSSGLADLAYQTGIVRLGGCSPKTPSVNQRCRKCQTEFYFNKVNA